MSKERGKVWLGASGLVIDQEGRWLVVKKTYGGLKGRWSFPAGFVEPGETVDMAAVREVLEETGLQCRVEGMIGFRTGVIGNEISDNMAIFLLRPLNDKQLLVAQEKEIAEVAWKTPRELQEDTSASVMLREMAVSVLESGFDEINNLNPGDIFNYTAYKLFFKKGR